jgi:hypothetical protein
MSVGVFPFNSSAFTGGHLVLRYVLLQTIYSDAVYQTASRNTRKKPLLRDISFKTLLH